MEAEAATSQTSLAAAPSRTSWLILPAAALAGAAALGLEMLWIRGFGRGVGTSHEALAAVAGVFLLGLGLGAAVGARRAVRSERPAMTAALALLVAGILAWVGPWYVAAVPGLHDALLDAVGAEGDGGALAAFVLVLPLVLPAAFLFGLSFPFLVRARTLDVRHAGRSTGWIYALNTLGSVVAVLLAVVLLGSWGETLTVRTAGACSIVAALLLLLAHRPLPHGSGPPTAAALGKGSGAGGEGIALLVSGAAALCAQLAWMRMLQPLAGSHVWGVALLFAPLLFALAFGAAVGGAAADRVRRSERLLPRILVIAGVATFLSLPLSGRVPLFVLSGADATATDRVGSLLFGFLFAVGPAAFAFGAALPAAVRVRADWSGTAADAAGRIYGWNAIGALLGSVLAGAWLLPLLGAERVLVLAGVLPIVAAAILRWRLPGKRRALSAALHAAPLVLLAWPGLIGHLMNAAPRLPEVIAARKPLPPGCQLSGREDLDLYSVWFAGTRASRPGDASGEPLRTFEGRAGRITLLEEPDGVVGLRRGALRESVFDADHPNRPSTTEFALGMLPMLLQPDPSSVLVIGHGAGWTVEAVLGMGPKHVDVAELDEAVLEAARSYRGLEQLPVERDERATLCTCDGRILLRRAARRAPDARYDVIVSQPSHPWTPASGHLFSQEAFAAGHAALTERGVFAQWLNLFDMTPDLLRSALASYRAVFEHVWVFRFPSELVLIGFRAPPTIDVARWEAAFAEDAPIAAQARGAGFANAGSLWKHIVLDTAGVDRIVPAGTPTLHDDVPRLELELAWRRVTLAAPKAAEAILVPGFPPRVEAMLPARTARGQWMSAAVHGWLDMGRIEEAEVWARKMRWGSSSEERMAQARSALAAQSPQRAATLLDSAFGRDTKNARLAARWLHATAEADVSTAAQQQAEQVRVQALLKAFPDDGRILAAAARLERFRGRIARARELFERAVKAKGAPAPAGTRGLLARLLLSEAFDRAALERARTLLAQDPATYEDLDSLDQLLRLVSQAGKEGDAQALEASFRTLQQGKGLAALRQAAGELSRHRFGAAVTTIEDAVDIWPGSATVHELQGLILLCARAAGDAGHPVPLLRPGGAVKAFGEAIKRADDKEAVRARGQRMLRWFGQDPAPLAPKPKTPKK